MRSRIAEMDGTAQTSISILVAAGLAIAMTVMAVLTWFYHDSKHRDLDSWIDYGFSGDTLRHVLIYYRSMFVSMVVFYVLFSLSCLLLQSEGHKLLRDGPNIIEAGPFGVLAFAFDLVLRGGFFDIMEHFNLHTTALTMNRENGWFVFYCFVFRMYYGLTLFRLAISFAWIWVKLSTTRKRHSTDYVPGRPEKV